MPPSYVPEYSGGRDGVFVMGRHSFTIPDGYTLEQITELAEERLREQRRNYNKTHPEIILQQRLRTYANTLRKHGFFVMKGTVPPPPWNELQERSILRAIQANQEGLRNE